MNSITLINDLYHYLSLLTIIEESEILYCKETEKPIRHLQKSVSLKYNTITAKLKSKGEEEKLLQDDITINFKMEDKKVLLENLYCIKKEREDPIKKYILQHLPSSLSITAIAVLDKEIILYLTIADKIAKEAYLYSSGDNYYPGYYSEIIIEDSWIALKQINHWNSRSIDHKKDYHLRDLEFYIPTAQGASKHFFQSEEIGKMIIQFSDRSSENNKKCGDKILEKLQEQKLLFKNRDF